MRPKNPRRRTDICLIVRVPSRRPRNALRTRALRPRSRGDAHKIVQERIEFFCEEEAKIPQLTRFANAREPRGSPESPILAGDSGQVELAF
jgi:hypothetical protein